MKTKLLLSTAILTALAASSANAGNAYVGAKLGYTSITGKETRDQQGNPFGFTQFNGKKSTSLNARGSQVSAVAGYEFNVADKFSIAPELEIGFNNAKASKKSIVSRGPRGSTLDSRNLRAKDFFGAYVNFGYKVTEKVKLFAKTGLQNTSFQYATKADLTPVFKAKKSKRLTGAAIGAGAEFNVTEKVALRLDYTYVNYGKINTNIKRTPGNINIKYSVKPSSNTITAGLIFKI